MFKKITNMLYNIARTSGKAASTINDIDTLMTGDLEKIAKRGARKAIYKANRKITNSISKKI